MENSIRGWSLARSGLRTGKTLGRSGSVNSVSGDSGIDSEYTHVSLGSSGFYPSLYVKIKYPTEADDAARSGMLTSCDFDEILEKLQDVFPTWEIYLDAKRMNHYTRHALPRTLTSESPQHRIIVKVKFTAWRSNIDTHSIRRIVEEVLNKDGEFFVELQCHKLQD